MGQVTVTIAGRPYRMACEDGEEERLAGLGELVDRKISQMRTSFGEIGDQRLIVMSAISLADELEEIRGRLARVEADLDDGRREKEQGDQRALLRSEAIADGLDRASERIEQFTRALNATRKD